jgi:RimJ/RimL family protein N-acetyltransferase
MIERLDTGQLCGCFWVSQMVPGHQAFVGMWMKQEARGLYSIEAAAQALRYTFEAGQFRQLWALTPWANAAALCQRMGFQAVASLDDFCLVGTRTKSVHVFRLTKEAWNGQHLPQGI